MRRVIAIGGNALLKPGEPLTAERQRANMAAAAGALAEIIGGDQTALVHGNGPQVGLLALESEAYKEVEAYPLDVLGAESQGMIGYIIEEALRAALGGRRSIAALLTLTEVAPDDPAFTRPAKPIGPVYDVLAAARLEVERGWTFAPQGEPRRRVVASPVPVAFPALEIIRQLVASGVVTICGGGGGVPVARDSAGALRGVEAVIDKDLTAMRLAIAVQAEELLILTDVDGVYRDWGGPAAARIATARPAELRAMTFAAGSMGPKVEAACLFCEATGGRVRIGALDQAGAVARGEAGTLVSP